MSGDVTEDPTLSKNVLLKLSTFVVRQFSSRIYGRIGRSYSEENKR